MEGYIPLSEAQIRAQIGQHIGQYGGTAKSAPPRIAPALAESIHSNATRLTELNDRLFAMLDRLANGHSVQEAAPPQQSPGSGALLVAQFGVTRTSNELERLSAVVNRLEEIA